MDLLNEHLSSAYFYNWFQRYGLTYISDCVCIAIQRNSSLSNLMIFYITIGSYGDVYVAQSGTEWDKLCTIADPKCFEKIDQVIKSCFGGN
jgi:hypothetical protein